MIKERKREGEQHGHDAIIDFMECMVVDMYGVMRDSCVDDHIFRPELEAEE